MTNPTLMFSVLTIFAGPVDRGDLEGLSEEDAQALDLFLLRAADGEGTWMIDDEDEAHSYGPCAVTERYGETIILFFVPSRS